MDECKPLVGGGRGHRGAGAGGADPVGALGEAQGGALQVDPLKSELKLHGTNILTLK